MFRRDTVERIIVADVLPGETLPIRLNGLLLHQQTGEPFAFLVLTASFQARTIETDAVHLNRQEGSGDYRDDPRYPVLVGPATTRQRREWRIRREQVSGFLFRPISSCVAAPSDWQQKCRAGL